MCGFSWVRLNGFRSIGLGGEWESGWRRRVGVGDCLNRMAVFENLGRDLKPKGFTGGSGEHYRVSVGVLLPVMLPGVSRALGELD